MKVIPGLLLAAGPWMAWSVGTAVPASRQGGPPSPPWGIGLESPGTIRLPAEVWDLVRDHLELERGEAVSGVSTDLTGDGAPDWLIRSPARLCGNGGCAFLLVDGFHRRIIGRFSGLPLYVLSRRVRNSPVIATWNHLSAHGGTWSTWAFDGTVYQLETRRDLSDAAVDSLFQALRPIPILRVTPDGRGLRGPSPWRFRFTPR